MTDPITRKIIEQAMPGARIIERGSLPGHYREGDGIAVLPSCEAMLRKWGHLKTGESVAVEVQVPLDDPTLPASLRRRTLILDPISGETIATSG